MKYITSRSHPFFKELAKTGKKTKERKNNGLTLLDGVHLVETYLAIYGPPVNIIISKSGCRCMEIMNIAQKQVENCIILNDALFREISPVKTPTGIMAVIAIPPAKKTPFTNSETFSILLESIQDPGNLGTILRSAAAAGVHNIYLSKGCADVWSPKVLRAAMGAHFFLIIFEQSNLAEIAKQHDGKIIATTTNAKKILYDISLTGPVAFVIGNEGNGLSNEILEISNEQISIPMPGKIESLNVASAAAICFFERVRQVAKKKYPRTNVQ